MKLLQQKKLLVSLFSFRVVRRGRKCGNKQIDTHIDLQTKYRLHNTHEVV